MMTVMMMMMVMKKKKLMTSILLDRDQSRKKHNRSFLHFGILLLAPVF